MFKRLQGFIIGFMVCALLFGGVAFAAEYVINPNSFPIFVNGARNDNIKALNVDGFTWIQLGSLKEVGIVVKFNETEKRIEISSVSPETNEQIKGELSMASQTIVQNDTSMLPDGASYVDNEKDGKQYKTVLLNGVTYISTSDLELIFGIKAQSVDVQNEQGIYVKDGTKIYLDLHNPGTVFTVGAFLYVPVDVFSQYMN
jgi:hypothetical protein